MQQLSAEGRRVVEDLAQRHGVSSDAVLTLLLAVAAGQGTQAQFNHPELGGMGQWSQGGMIMVGDMFNNALKYRVDALCTELSGILRGSDLFAAPPQPAQYQSQSQGGQGNVSLFVPGSSSWGNWWPADLGTPSSTGAQNNLRYAFFPGMQRLAIENGGMLSIYDTGDHQISGFSQQQSGDQSLTFTSQYGLVRVADLPVVGAASGGQPIADVQHEPEAAPQAMPAEPAESSRENDQRHTASITELHPQSRSAASEAPDDIFSKIERLADLRQKGILTDQEFEAKKAELLSRL